MATLTPITESFPVDEASLGAAPLIAPQGSLLSSSVASDNAPTAVLANQVNGVVTQTNATALTTDANINAVNDEVATLQTDFTTLRTDFDKIVKGTATISPAGTSVTVSLGATSADTSYRVAVTPTSDFGHNFATGPAVKTNYLWVSGKTTTQFTINLAHVPDTATNTFDWIAYLT